MLISRLLFSRASIWTIYRPVWGLLSDTRQGLPVPLHSIAPFVEIPDLLNAPGIVLDANKLEVVNAGARFGVIGQEIMTRDMDDVYQRLSVFRVELEGSGGVIGMRGHGSSLLGHPVHVVRWVREGLKSQDRKLQAGNWISLGSMTGL